MSPPGDMTISFCETQETSSSNWTGYLSEKAAGKTVVHQTRSGIDAEAGDSHPAYHHEFGEPLEP